MHQCTCGAFVRVHGTGILGSRARYRVRRRVGLRGRRALDLEQSRN